MNIKKLFKRQAILPMVLIAPLMLIFLYLIFLLVVNSNLQSTQDSFVKKVQFLDLYTFRINSGNFEPTFYHGDLITFTKNPDLSKLKRGTLLLYDTCLYKSEVRNCIFFSRIVGLPNETISLRERHIEINGSKLNEPYAQWRDNDNTLLSRTHGYSRYVLNEPISIPPDSYFLLDDDRTWDYHDSRTFGPIFYKDVIGVYRFTLIANPLTRLY